jgi:hypothetical protein
MLAKYLLPSGTPRRGSQTRRQLRCRCPHRERLLPRHGGELLQMLVQAGFRRFQPIKRAAKKAHLKKGQIVSRIRNPLASITRVDTASAVSRGLPHNVARYSTQFTAKHHQQSAESKIWSPGGEIGRRARLRITKSSISKQRFSFRKMIDLREENALFHVKIRLYKGRVETSSF